jgi:hypothetical protein
MHTGKLERYDSGVQFGLIRDNNDHLHLISPLTPRSGGAALRAGQQVEFELDANGHVTQIRPLEVSLSADRPGLRPFLDSLREPAPSPAVAVPPRVIVKRPALLNVVESARRQEPIGEETRSFNNALSSSTAIETIKVTHTARVSASVDLDKARSVSGRASVGFTDIARAQASLGNDLTRHYSLTTGGELAHEQTTQISVPARTNVQVTFYWFRVWASGSLAVAELAKPGAALAEVPFEITVELGFNKETRDMPGFTVK